jgi:hypothetical protein
MAIVLVALAFAPAAADREGRDGRGDENVRLRVAVVPGVAINLDTSRVDALSQDLADSLAAELEVEVIGGLEVRRQLPADGVPDECAVTPSCAADIASRLGVSQLLFVTMVNTGAGGSIQVDTTWVDPGAGQRVSRPAIDLATVSSAKERFSAAATKLLPDAPPRKKQQITTMQFDKGVPRHFTATTIVTSGITLAALGTGIGFGLSTRAKYNACDDTSGCPDGEKKSIRARALVADVSFAIALAGAITTAVLWGTSAESPQVMVNPTRDGATVSGMMRF